MYVYDDCDNAIPDPSCAVCTTPELARVRAAGFVRSDFEFTDITDQDEWDQGKTDRKIYHIPATQGSFDGGTPKIVPGFGNIHQRRTSSAYKLNFFDANYIANAEFYNVMQKAGNWRPFFATETQVHLADKVAAIVPKAVVANDDEAEVIWEIECTWVSTEYPLPHDVPDGMFDCEEIV